MGGVRIDATPYGPRFIQHDWFSKDPNVETLRLRNLGFLNPQPGEYALGPGRRVYSDAATKMLPGVDSR
jgi:hypothetical protein